MKAPTGSSTNPSRHTGEHPTFRVATGSWTELGAPASAVRAEVFIVEQGIPKELEWDDEDAQCIHALALNGPAQAIGTGRLLPAQGGVARIGRMAVLRAWRGQGVGAAVLQALLAQSARRGDRQVVLHAQHSAVAFYARHGFVARGEPFVEAGIDHREMVLDHPL